MSDNTPKNPKLWEKILDLGRGKSNTPITENGVTVNPVNEGKGFKTWPSAYGVGWALAQYKRLGGKWEKKKKKTAHEVQVHNVLNRYAGKRDDPKLKNTGHGGLDTWFAGHGGGKEKERSTWGDWVAITPVKHTITKEDGKKKTYEAGDIVGPCGISSEKEWSSVTDGGKRPLKCMPRAKAYQMSKEERATLARIKKREESKQDGQKPVNTPTFNEEAKKKLKKK